MYLGLYTNSVIDNVFRAVVVIVAAILAIKYGSLFEEEYNKKLADLYVYPWWRLLIVLIVISAALWCPRVGIIVALLAFFYLSDMNLLLTPLPNL